MQFNELGATLIFYNEVYVYTDLILENDEFHDTSNSKIHLSEDYTIYTSPSELAKL